MTVPPFPSKFISPLDIKHYNGMRLTRQNSEPTESLLRAQSVCLSRRPQSGFVQRAASVRSDSERYMHSQKELSLGNEIKIKSAKRKPYPITASKKIPPQRTPCAISVKTLSIPMTYFDPDATCSLTNPDPMLRNPSAKSKHNPRKQVVADKEQRHITRGKETQNKLLLQISEADQVSDFERILNSNAILWHKKQAVRGVGTSAIAPGAIRPSSNYSVSNVSETYNYLFQRHIDSVQQLIDDYKNVDKDVITKKEVPGDSILGQHWCDNIQHLSEFYDDDSSLQEELQTITDQIIDDEVRSIEENDKTITSVSKNFNVNLSGLIIANSFGIHGDGVSDNGVLTPELNSLKADFNEESDEENEWNASIMNADFHKFHDKENENIEHLAQNLNNIDLEKNTNVPKITLSNYCDSNVRSDSSNKSTVNINLAVPSIEKSIEARPPI